MNLNVFIQRSVTNRWEIILKYNEKSLYDLENEEIFNQANEFAKVANELNNKDKFKGMVFFDYKNKEFVDSIKKESKTQAIVGLAAENIYEIEMFLIEIISVVNRETNLVQKIKISYSLYNSDLSSVATADRFGEIIKFCNTRLYK